MTVQKPLFFFALCLIGSVGCGPSERMAITYAQRCATCHGAGGNGDGPVAAAIAGGVPDFRRTVEVKSNAQMRRIIGEGRGIMPAFAPALTPGEINDMVRMVRLLSREGRQLSWWEKYDVLVMAHCSVPWEAVLGLEDGPESGQADKR
jgi:hypothetical protein